MEIPNFSFIYYYFWLIPTFLLTKCYVWLLAFLLDKSNPKPSLWYSVIWRGWYSRVWWPILRRLIFGNLKGKYVEYLSVNCPVMGWFEHQNSINKYIIKHYFSGGKISYNLINCTIQKIKKQMLNWTNTFVCVAYIVLFICSQ